MSEYTHKSRIFKICASGDTAELKRVRDFVEEKSRQFGFSEEGASKLMLAVDEACSNLIRHSYLFDKNRQFCVEISWENNGLVIEIYDTGVTFNPLSVTTPNMQEYFSKFLRGGLGVHIIRKIMDGIEYIPADSSHPFNILRMMKTPE